MRRRRWIMILVASGILLLLAIAWPQREPTYEGRGLRAWLKGFHGSTPEARWHSAEAVRRIGTNALPLLIAQLSHGRPGPALWWKRKLWALLSRLSLVNINLFRPSDERGEALAGLDALGPNAKGALPAVEKLLHEKPPDYRALLILARIGPEGIPALTRALTNEERLIRLGARSCLDMLGSHSEILFPNTPEDGEFERRTCRFNLALIGAAFKDYRSQHPEQFPPGGLEAMPRQSLPPSLGPPKAWQTNEGAAPAPQASRGFQ